MLLILILISILVLLILLLIFLTYMYTPSSLQKNKFSIRAKDNAGINISFFSQEETSNFLLSDLDNYILNMSKIDFQARGMCGDTSTYYKNICASLATDFSQEEKQELISLMNIVKNNFKNTMYAKTFDNNIIFAKTNIGEYSDPRGEYSDPRGEYSDPRGEYSDPRGEYSDPRGEHSYENGFPHTRYNIIFLSPLFFKKSNKINFKQNKSDKINTLEHECIHIFQRFYQIDTEEYLNSMGFEKKGDFKTLFPDLYKLKRSNPDIDNNIWTDPNGNFMFPIFSSENPKSLNDVTSHDMEHPYEWMAYRN